MVKSFIMNREKEEIRDYVYTKHTVEPIKMFIFFEGNMDSDKYCQNVFQNFCKKILKNVKRILYYTLTTILRYFYKECRMV